MLDADEPMGAIDRVIAAMRAPDPAIMTLHDMADLACLSPFHFSRLFRRATGAPPAAFFGALRLDRAKRLLLSSELSVTEICFALGYASLGAFTTRFTHHVGLSPGRFRRLPEVTAAALDAVQMAETPPLLWPDAPPDIAGRVIGSPLMGPTFVGLFPVAMALGWPAAGTVIPRPGPFGLPLPADGGYSLLAVALPVGCDPVLALAPDSRALVGSAAAPLTVFRGRVYGTTEITLRRFLLTDAPVLIALPPLLFGAADGAGKLPIQHPRKRNFEEVSGHFLR